MYGRMYPTRRAHFAGALEYADFISTEKLDPSPSYREMTLNYLMQRLQLKSCEEYGVPLRCLYLQVYSDPEW